MSETEWKTETSEPKTSQVEIPEVLPLLPIRDIVIYPYMMLPLFVGRDVSIRAVEEALARDRLIRSTLRMKIRCLRKSIALARSPRSCGCSSSRMDG